MRLPWLFALAVLAVIAAACGGGGGSSVAPGGSSPGGTGTTATAGPTAAASTTSNNKSVALSIVIPKSTTSSSKTRSPKYIPSNTQSMTLTLLSVNGASQSGPAQGPFNLTAPTASNPNPNCTTVTTGLKCTFSITAPVGNDIFTANTFSGANAVGALGSGAIALSVTTNASNTASLTLDGPVASVSLFSATGGNLSNGNPLPQPTAEQGGSLVRAPGRGTMSASQARAIHAAYVAANSSRATNGRVRIEGSATPSPTPTSAVQTSSRIFVIALDAAGNQIINPTTFDIPITLTLALNGTPPGVLTLGVAYAGLSAADTGNASIAADGATLTVYSPTDQITLSISGTSASMNPYTPGVSASYTPQGGTLQVTAPLAFAVNLNPPGPTYGITNTHTGPLVTGNPGTIYANVFNTGTAGTTAALEVDGEIDYATINSFSSPNSANFWSCDITYSGEYYSDYTCTSSNSIAAGFGQSIAINVTPTESYDVSHYTTFYADENQYATAYDDIPVSGVATPTPSPSAYLAVAAYANPAPTPMIYTNDLTQYTINVSNTGNFAATAPITLTNALPAGFSYDSGTGTNWSCTLTGATVTCTYNQPLAINASAPTLTLTESAGNSTAFTTVGNTFALSGGGGAVSSGTVTSSVLPALQFTSAMFSQSVTFTPASASNPSAVLDFGTILNFGETGPVTLQSFYTATGAQYATPTIESETDGCYPEVTASPNPVPSFVPLTTPYGATIVLGNAGAAGPCTISITDGNGSNASLTLQAQSTSITVNGKGRKK